MSSVGERIAKLKKDRNLNNIQFGELCNISASSVSNIETGQTESPGILIFHRIKEAFNLSPEDAYELVFGEKIESRQDFLNQLAEKEKLLYAMDVKYNEEIKRANDAEKMVDRLLDINKQLAETVNRLTAQK